MAAAHKQLHERQVEFPRVDDLEIDAVVSPCLIDDADIMNVIGSALNERPRLPAARFV